MSIWIQPGAWLQQATITTRRCQERHVRDPAMHKHKHLRDGVCSHWFRIHHNVFRTMLTYNMTADRMNAHDAHTEVSRGRHK